MNISRRQKLALGIFAAVIIAIPATVWAQSTYFNETFTASIHSAPVLTLVSVISQGINAGVSGCTSLPAGSDGSSVVSLVCSIDATRGNVGTVIVTLHANYPINGVTVAMSGPSTDFTITNPAPQTVSTTNVAFSIGLTVLSTAPDSAPALTFVVTA